MESENKLGQWGYCLSPQALPRNSTPHGLARGQVRAGFVPLLASTLALQAFGVPLCGASLLLVAWI